MFPINELPASLMLSGSNFPLHEAKLLIPVTRRPTINKNQKGFFFPLSFAEQKLIIGSELLIISGLEVKTSVTQNNVSPDVKEDSGLKTSTNQMQLYIITSHTLRENQITTKEMKSWRGLIESE